MRPRYLEIEGLQSFKEKQAIDFDKLSETGLFGIFGPTGSGKSTVLDAITLALYGNVQRAARGTQGIINTGSSSLRVAFVFDLLKDGSRKTYRVERIYRRKKDSDNSAEARTARLVEVRKGGDFPLADKPGEVTSKIVELIGLQPDDFTRSVVLPQNRFQEFLTLEKAKRREMLERIFYLEEYGRQLTEKVNRKLHAVRAELSGIEGAMSMLGDASEKALIEAESRMQAARERKERLDEELKRMELVFTEAREVWELTNELNLVSEKEREHVQRLEEINEKRKMCEDAAKAAALTDFIEKYRETRRNLAATVAALEELDKGLPELEKDLAEAAAEHDRAREQSALEKPRLIEQRAKLNEAVKVREEIDGIEARLKVLRAEYLKLKDQAETGDGEINGTRMELELSENKERECATALEGLKVDIDYRNKILEGMKLESELRNAWLEKEKHRQKCNELSSRISGLEEKLKEWKEKSESTHGELEKLKAEQNAHEKARPFDRNKVLHDIDGYHKLRGLVEALKFKKSAVDVLEDRLSGLKMQAEQQRKKAEEASGVRDALKSGLEEKRKELEELNRQLEMDSAYMLAARLKEGDPCPVCGSTHHPSPASQHEGRTAGETEGLIKAAKEQYEKLEKEYRSAENECIKLDEQLKALDIQIDQVVAELVKNGEEYKWQWALLPPEMQGIEPEELDAELEKIKTSNERKLETIDEWEARLDTLKKAILETSNRLSEQVAGLNAIEAELKVNRENLNQAEVLLAATEADYGKKLEQYREFIEKYNITDAASELKKIEEKDRQSEELQKQLQQLREKGRTLRNRLEGLEKERAKLANRMVEVENDGKNLRAQKEKYEAKVRELTGGNEIEAQLKVVDDRLKLLEQEERRIAELVKALEGRLNEAKTRKSTLENQKVIYSKALEEEGARLGRLLEDNGFESPEAVEKALLPKEQQEALALEIREYEQAGRNLQARKEIIQKKLGNRSITEEEWQRTCSGYDALKLEREEGIKAFEAAKINYFNIKENFEKWLELDKRLKHYSKKQDMLEQIQKLLKGNSFVEFIAEERLRYISREASETLGQLTRHRYAIEMDTEYGFVIRDYSNGGAIRMVSSLSGGETFLTSLSLALALSKQIQLKGQSPLEFFFLDEGFGTLDASLLDTVIDALERLSSGERVIGLISHVPELKNRMARRLIVEPPMPDGRGSRVRIEKA